MVSPPLKTPCSLAYHAYRSSGERNPKVIRWVVMHATGSTVGAKANARYFASPQAAGSAHLIVDDTSCFRTLFDKEIPWAAPGANSHGFHIELCAPASWSREEWLKHRPMLERGAYKTATRCLAYNLPARWVGPIGLRFGRKGLTTHVDVSKWQKTPGGHWDPGPGFPKDVFLQMVKKHLAALKEA